MASSFIVSGKLLPYANPIASTGLRFILASLLMLPFIYRGYVRILTLSLLLKYAVISLFLVLFFLGMFESLKTTTPMRTSVIYTLLPLLSVLFTFMALRQLTPKRQLLGFILGTIGAIWVLLIFNQDSPLQQQWYRGDSIFLLACCCLALHVVLIKKWTSDVPPAQGAFYVMFIGGLILLPFLLLFGDLQQVGWHQDEFWQVLLYLTVFTTMATFFLQQRLLKKVGPNHLLAYTYLLPGLVVMLQGYINIAQLYSSLPGIILTFLALYLISRR